MNYIIRVLRYFVKICVLAALVLVVLAYAKVIPSDINEMFKDGLDSVWKIAAMFFAVSCLYPKFGYVSRGVLIPGEFEAVKEPVVKAMEEKGYVLTEQEGEDMIFRSASPAKRILRLGDDRIAFKRKFPGFVIEGKSKDVVRLAGALEYKFRENE